MHKICQVALKICPPASLNVKFIYLGNNDDYIRRYVIWSLYRIPNELLKHGSSTFKHYLMHFLNKILEEGSVPEELNIGKCVLIYKVYFSKIILFSRKCSIVGW